MRLFLLLLFPCALMAESPFVEDGPEEQAAYSREMNARFQAGKFAELEAEAVRLRTGERLSDGLWKLPCFYRGIEQSSGSPEEFDARLKEWEKAFPDSPTVAIARAAGFIQQAWAARGGGWADTVTPEGWRLFREKLGEARASLETVPPQQRTCPGWFGGMLTVALGQAWNNAEEEALFDAAVAKWPDYYDFYFSRAYYLLPRWHGKPGDWEAFALKCAERQPDGPMIYARIIWSLRGMRKAGPGSDVKWPLMRKGFETMMERWPQSLWNRSNFCLFAYEMGDYACAKQWLSPPGSRIYSGVTLKPETVRFLQSQ